MEYIHPFLCSILNDWKGHIASICSTYIIHDAFISYLLEAQLQLAAVLGLLLAKVKYFSDKAEIFCFWICGFGFFSGSFRGKMQVL